MQSSPGDSPDAIFIARKLFSLSQVTIYGQQGLFIPLDKLIDEYAPHVVDMFTTFPEMRTQFTSPDGRMYGLPNMNECYHCKSQNVRTWINDDSIQVSEARCPRPSTTSTRCSPSSRGMRISPATR